MDELFAILHHFSIVIQSCQDDLLMIMKGCVQWNLFTVEKIMPQAGLQSGTAKSVGQPLTPELHRLSIKGKDRVSAPERLPFYLKYILYLVLCSVLVSGSCVVYIVLHVCSACTVGISEL